MPRCSGGGRPRREDAEWVRGAGATFDQPAEDFFERRAMAKPNSAMGTCRDVIQSYRPKMPFPRLEKEALALKEALRAQRKRVAASPAFQTQESSARKDVSMWRLAPRPWWIALD